MNSVDTIRDLLREGPQDIRVLCTRGHLIVDMTLSVINGQLVTRRRRSRKDLRRKASRRQPALYADLHVSADRNTVLECVNRHCHYRGYRNEMLLALELAESALAGHAEHRLTT